MFTRIFGMIPTVLYFGGGKTPDVPAVPDPTPTPIAGDVTPQQTAEQKRNKIAALRFGAQSTMLTGGRGISGTGSNLQPATGQGQGKTLGA
jgi:hypothetical protein